MGCCGSKDEKEPLMGQQGREQKVNAGTKEGGYQQTTTTTKAPQNSAMEQQQQSQQQENEQVDHSANGQTQVVDPAESVVQRAQHDLINVSQEPSGALNSRESEKRGAEYRAVVASSKPISDPAIDSVVGVPISKPKQNQQNQSSSQGQGQLATSAASDILSTSIPTTSDADLVGKLAETASTGFNNVKIKDVGPIVSALPTDSTSSSDGSQTQ